MIKYVKSHNGSSTDKVEYLNTDPDIPKNRHDIAFSLPMQSFAASNRVILSDLNNQTNNPVFRLYTKTQINDFLRDPYRFQQELRNAVIYIYGASSHFRKIIQILAGLTDMSYIVTPRRFDATTDGESRVRRNYTRTKNLVAALDIRNQWDKIVTVCLREDTFYGTLWVTNDIVTLQQLPSEYCAISTIENNVFNVTFDFSYFNANLADLAFYPEEFTEKYNLYLTNQTAYRWQELDSPNSFAVKCNKDIPTYALPPFAGLLREIYDLEDYKQMKLTKTRLSNYALLVMKNELNDEGNWKIPYQDATTIWQNLNRVIPEEVGSVLTPMDIEKISFERSTGDTDANHIADAEERLFSAAGISSLLFNNPNASAPALKLSIQSNQSMTFGIVRSIESVINRFLWNRSFARNFQVRFLDISTFNRVEYSNMYLKGCQSGMPLISAYAASLGFSQDEFDGLNFLEDEVLMFKDKFEPMRTSYTMTNSVETIDVENNGRDRSDISEITDEAEQSRELRDDGSEEV